MTTTAVPAPTGAAPRVVGASALAGTGTLIRFILRRDRVRLPVWLAGITLVQVAGAASYPDLYPTVQDRQAQALIIVDNPAMRAMTGPGHGVEDYTFGAMFTNEYLGFMVIFVALMSILLVVRHTRAEEETGRAELVRASVVGRHAHLTAALTVAAGANVVLGLLIAAGMGGLGIETVDWPGSLLFGAAFTAVGLVFTGVAAVTTQISEYGRAASGIAGATIGLAYVLRAVGDVADNGLSWLSPIGWAQATAAYVDNNWWPLGLALVATAALVGFAFALSNRRDIGAGLRQPSPGRPTASAFLGTPAGFAWRLQRSGFLWWALAMFLFGVAYGSAIDIIEDYADNEIIQEIVSSIGGATLTESWLSMIISLVAIIATIFAITAALRPRREEAAGRADAVLATALSRSRWVASHATIALAGGPALLLISGLGFGLSAAAAGQPDLFWDLLGATLGYAPAVWLTTGLVVAGYGFVPRATGLAWVLLGYAIFIVYLGGLLKLPDWMFNLSPYTHIPRMPAADFNAVPLVVLTLIATVLVAAGLFGFRRRDVEAN